MAKQQKFDEPEDDVPAWVMTFSDVITLLMTFFILLLTFATNTPETFDRLQVTMFAGGGSTGFAGDVDGMDKDAILTRMRARSGRTAEDGSTMPPLYSDPTLASMAESVAGLDEKEKVRNLSNDYHLTQKLDSIVGSKGVSSIGAQQMKMLAKQMRKLPLKLDLVVGDESQVARALELQRHMTEVQALGIATIGISVSPDHVASNDVLFVITKEGASRGEKN